MLLKTKYYCIFVSVAYFMFEAHGYPGGAQNNACEGLSPSHGGNISQTDISPFQIKVNTTKVENGKIIEVSVESDDPKRTFKGLIFQARADISVYETKGTFIIEDGSETKPLKCQRDADTVTHISKDPKNVVKFYYNAPAGYEGVVTIVGTVVENYAVFYEKIQSEQISVRNGLISTEVPPSTEIPSNNDTFFDTCGISKSCFGYPNNCIKRKSCSFVTSVARFSDGPYVFELISFQTQASYVGLALSSTEFMSETSVTECVKEANGQIKKHDSWMTTQPRGVTRENVMQDTTKSIWTNVGERMFLCRFERAAKTVVRGKIFDLDNIEYHLLIASGTALSGNGVGPHDLGASSSDKRLLGNIQVFASPSSLFYKLHGVFMFTAWIGTTTIGVFFARYYKQQWKGRQFMGKDIWFVGHQTSMILTFLLTMVGFILIFVKIQAWSDTSNPHPILGVITTIMCFIQPIGAIFRPAPNDKNRRWFNWIHFIIGNSTHLLAIITIFFAVSVPKAKLSFEMYYIMISFCLYYSIAHVLCSIATEQESLKQSKKESTNSWKGIFLMFHVVIVITFNVVGVVQICRANAVVTEM